MSNRKRRAERPAPSQTPRDQLRALPFGKPEDDEAAALPMRTTNAHAEVMVIAAAEREIRRYEDHRWNGVITLELPVKKGVVQKVDTFTTVHEQHVPRKAA